MKRYTIFDYGIGDDELKKLLVKEECLSWMNKHGEKIMIKNMETSYINNCINRIKKLNWRLEWLDYLQEVSRNRLIQSRIKKLDYLNKLDENGG